MGIAALCSNQGIVTVEPDAPVLEAARLMRARHVGYLVVTETGPGGRRLPVGILTDRDIVVEAVAQGVDPATLQVGDIMSRRPAVLGHRIELPVALERMRQLGVRRMPVVGEQGEIKGVLSIDEVIGAMASDMSAVAASLRRQQHVERDLRR